MDPAIIQLFENCDKIVTDEFDWMVSGFYSKSYKILQLNRFLKNQKAKSSLNPAAKLIFEFLIEQRLFELNY